MTGTSAEPAAVASPLPEKTATLMRRATYAAVAVALVLVAAKFGAWLATDSVSLLSTMIDSLLDAGASMINLLAVRRALRPASREFRFGHGKAEPLAGLGQSAFICGSALFLLIESAVRFVHPRDIVNTEIGFVVMAVSIVLTVGLVVFQKYVVRRTGSVAISADSLHYQTDVLINLSVIVSLWLAGSMGWTLADPLFAVAIAGYLAWGAVRIGRESLDLLMDRELPEEDRLRIREITLAHGGVIDMHDLRTRSSGNRSFIQLHLEMDGKITLNEAHEIAERVMFSVEEAFPRADVIIHQDPEGVEERREPFDDSAPRPDGIPSP